MSSSSSRLPFTTLDALPNSCSTLLPLRVMAHTKGIVKGILYCLQTDNNDPDPNLFSFQSNFDPCNTAAIIG